MAIFINGYMNLYLDFFGPSFWVARFISPCWLVTEKGTKV